MLSQTQIKEIREHLKSSQNPLFFFDNDTDGLCSFLLLARYIGKGKGVAIKSYPDLNKSYARKLYELNPDYVFILDKPVVSDEFLEEAKKMNLPVVWIDHHESSEPVPKEVYYYNPAKNSNPSTEPVTYLSWKITDRKQDLWLAMIGCIGDNYFPDFAEEFNKKYPDLYKEAKSASEILYEAEIGKLTRVLDFALKDRTSNVVRMLKTLLKTESPYEVLKDESRNKILARFKQINRKYIKLVKKAEKFSNKGKILFFQYGGDLSLSSNISNELSYKFPNKIIVVAYLKGTKVNISLRGENVRDITLKAIQDLEEATGGGHENATGAKIEVEDLPEFKKKIEKLVR